MASYGVEKQLMKNRNCPSDSRDSSLDVLCTDVMADQMSATID